MSRLGLESDLHGSIEEQLIVLAETRDERVAVGEIDETLSLEATALVQRQSHRQNGRLAEERAYLGLVGLETNVRYVGRERRLLGHELEVDVGRQRRLGRRRKL